MMKTKRGHGEEKVHGEKEEEKDKVIEVWISMLTIIR